jgi:virginiamycin B lyase
MITPAGVATEYTIPTSNAGPEDITTGPDGALWFTESTSDKIGQVVLSNTSPAPAPTPSLPNAGATSTGLPVALILGSMGLLTALEVGRRVHSHRS